MKKLSLIMAVIMAALVIALPASATGASSTFTPGEIIYCENFSNVPDTDDLSVIEASLGYKVVAVDTSTLDYTMTEKNISAAIKYSVKDGKLCVDNTADDCAYSYLYIYDSDSMKDLVKTTYTVQYERSPMLPVPPHIAAPYSTGTANSPTRSRCSAVTVHTATRSDISHPTKRPSGKTGTA